jgi:hypothetical protein
VVEDGLFFASYGVFLVLSLLGELRLLVFIAELVLVIKGLPFKSGRIVCTFKFSGKGTGNLLTLKLGAKHATETLLLTLTGGGEGVGKRSVFASECGLQGVAASAAS